MQCVPFRAIYATILLYLMCHMAQCTKSVTEGQFVYDSPDIHAFDRVRYYGAHISENIIAYVKRGKMLSLAFSDSDIDVGRIMRMVANSGAHEVTICLTRLLSASKIDSVALARQRAESETRPDGTIEAKHRQLHVASNNARARYIAAAKEMRDDDEFIESRIAMLRSLQQRLNTVQWTLLVPWYEDHNLSQSIKRTVRRYVEGKLSFDYYCIAYRENVTYDSLIKAALFVSTISKLQAQKPRVPNNNGNPFKIMQVVLPHNPHYESAVHMLELHDVPIISRHCA